MNIAKERQAIIHNPERGRGVWRMQDEYFANHQPNYDGVDVVSKIDPEHANEAYKWNSELCCGDQNAMVFCDNFYHYAHMLDDLVDTLRDGRPAMSKEQIISIFFRAALLYNCSFYIANRDALFPIILETTNMWQVSVAWERSSKSHLRLMGDVFRCCGNRVFSMVALITGGEKHMLEMTKRMHERDWIAQHSDDGSPL